MGRGKFDSGHVKKPAMQRLDKNIPGRWSWGAGTLKWEWIGVEE